MAKVSKGAKPQHVTMGHQKEKERSLLLPKIEISGQHTAPDSSTLFIRREQIEAELFTYNYTNQYHKLW